MTKIASDAMVIQLAIDMAGDGEVQQRLSRLNDFINTINTKAAKGTGADSLRQEQMAIEGKYNPEVQRNLEIEKAIALTAKYNLSAETQLAMLSEIEEKHRRIVDLIQQQSPEGQAAAALAKDQASAAKAAAAATAAADEEIVRSKAKAAKEVAAIEEEQLSHSKRASKRQDEIREMQTKGLINPAQAMTLHRENKRIFDEAVAHDTKLLKSKQDAADKLLAQEQAEVAKRTAAFHKEVKDRAAARRAMIDASRDAAIESTQRKAKAAIDATTLADNESNAAKARAINLLNSLEDATQRFARTTDELRAHLDAGDITNEQYAQGLANIERRQRSMAGGSNNMAYAIGNTVTGLEDFITVLSITGFGMDGFSAATRAASNNVGQAVRSLGTAGAAIAAPIVSIGMVLLGSAIPAIYNWISGVEDAEKATKKWSREMEIAIRLAGMLGRIELRKLNFAEEVKDVKNNTSSDALKEQYGELNAKYKVQVAEIKKTLAESEASALLIFDKLVPTETIEDFNDFVDNIGVEFGGDVEEGFRIRLKDMQTEFIRIAVEKDAEEARKVLLSRMRLMQADMEALRPGSSSSNPFDRIGGMADMGIDGGLGNSFVNLFPEGINDAAVIDQIEALEGKIEELSGADSEAARIKKEELQETVELLKVIHEQYQVAKAAEKALNDEQARIEGSVVQQQIDSELRALTIQQKRASLLGDENEAERALLDLAMKREQMGASGTIPDDVLNNLFNMELEAIAADLEKQIAKAEEITRAVGMATEPEAYTSAQKQIMEVAGKDKTKLQEQIDLLKAIRDQLASGTTMSVEIT